MFPQGKNEYVIFSVTLNSHNCLFCSMLRKMTDRILFCHKFIPAYLHINYFKSLLQFISIYLKQVNQLQAHTFLRAQAFTIFPIYFYFKKLNLRKIILRSNIFNVHFPVGSFIHIRNNSN